MTNKELGAKLDRVIELLEKQQQNTFTILPQLGAIPSNTAWDCGCAPGQPCMNIACPRALRPTWSNSFTVPNPYIGQPLPVVTISDGYMSTPVIKN
jgi:hypothetical protein